LGIIKPLQLAGAMFKEVMTFRFLQAELLGAHSRAFEMTACS
jgi:hypothetical protein